MTKPAVLFLRSEFVVPIMGDSGLKFLVVGCGSLGSEVIKLLRNMKCNLTIIDYDIIETSNLSRQFFFLESERNKFKSEVIGTKVGCKYVIGNINNLENSFLDGFDVVFSCLDNISSRMQLNYLFFHSKCVKLIDCGVEGFRAHAKRVTRDESCLYCIRNLYNTDKIPYICSLRNTRDQKITEENREIVLRAMVFKAKELQDAASCSEKNIQDVVSGFNSTVSEELKTNYFEVEGIYNGIMANTCTINSLCASLSVVLAFDDKNANFVFIDCTNELALTKIEIEKDPGCFICNQKTQIG